MVTPTIDQILRAASGGSSDRIYFLGPYAKRINFAAQQNRAMNLVYALVKTGRIEKDSPCAVIGAGLAGLTAATVLHLLGYSVHLFDRADTVLARQRATSHRILHPTVNAWPFEADLEPTTELPVYDWCAGVCDEVLTDMVAEWNALAGTDLQAARQLHLGTHVEDFEERDHGVMLVARPPVPEEFGTVIFAIGFADERPLNNADEQSYWRSDGAEEVRNLDGHARFVVSGTGDGGLIDALRLSYRDFGKGALPLQIVTQLAGTEAERLVKDAENAFRIRKIEQDLFNAYCEAAKQLPVEAVAMLENSRVRTPALVTLVGEDATLTARGAAPIHKLLVTYTWQETTVRYLQGEVRIAKNKSVVIKTPQGSRTIGGKLYPPLVRHGADNALEALLGNHPDVLSNVKEGQKVLADYFVRPVDPDWLAKEIDLVPPAFASQDFRSSESWKSRRRKLQNLSRIWPHLVSVGIGTDGYEVSVDGQGWVPPRLFGVTTTSAPPAQAVRK